jgi:hypothetical protein
VHVQVEDPLTSVRAGIYYQSITGLVDAFLLRQLTGNGEQVSDDCFIFLLYLIYGGNVLLGYYQNVGRRYRMDVAEGGNVFVLKKNLPRTLTGNDSTKATGVHGLSGKKCESFSVYS